MLYLLPLFLPFVSFIILLVSGPFFKNFHNISRLTVCGVSVFVMFINFFFSYVFFVDLKTNDFVTEITFFRFLNIFASSASSELFVLNEYSLIGQNYFFNYTFLFDTLTVTMILVVVGVSCLVQLFSIEYMALDLFVVRFFAFLNFFSLCMLVLVTAGNFVQMFVGWEGVGVASFLLIGFWFGRSQAVKCALKAVIVNRVGDCALLLAFSLIAFYFGDLSYVGFFSFIRSGASSLQSDGLGVSSSVFNDFADVLLTSSSVYLPDLLCSLDQTFIFHKVIYFIGFKVDLLFLIGLLLCIGAFAKSAQFGLHT